MTEPSVEYARRLAKWDAEIARREREHQTIANLRLAVMIAAVAGALAAIFGRLSTWWIGLALLVFVVLVIVHDRVLQRRAVARRARRLYERGQARLGDTWQGSGPDGARFVDDHPYARDLDLFGPASLFQLLDTARTDVGERTLADWLRHSADPDDIRARQESVDELRPRVDFREAIALVADGVQSGNVSGLAAWGASPPAGLSTAIGIACAISACVTAGLGLAVYFGAVAIVWLPSWLLVQMLASSLWRERVRAALTNIDGVARDLEPLAIFLDRVELESFTSARLARLRHDLDANGLRPSSAVRRLGRYVAVLDSCKNQVFAPFAALLLVRSQMAVAIDRWHATHGQAIAVWLRAVGEIEALSALATYAYEHPADAFPEIVGDETVFDAEGLGHPLLADAATVRNDVAIGGAGPRVLIVSGSNMSGKSTLLRAIGVNVVLALAGAPVRAVRLRLSRMEIGATLRIEDSLAAGRSKFYAEILRIRQIVDVARGRTPLLFLLDEILGGTNSHDRRIGANAIVAALVGYGAIGLITTHDLALTDLAQTIGAAALNVHFEDRIEEGAMVFDYRMRPGVVERSNALELMRAVGLDV